MHLCGMINLDELRKALGDDAQHYNDGQLEELGRQIYGMAELLLDIYLDKRGRSRQGLSTLTNTDSDRTLKSSTRNRHAEIKSHDPTE